MRLKHKIRCIDTEKSSDINFLNLMARLHNALCDIVDDLNVCYSLQVILIIWRLVFWSFFGKSFWWFRTSTDYADHWSVLSNLDIVHLLDLQKFIRQHWTIATNSDCEYFIGCFLWTANHSCFKFFQLVDERWKKSTRNYSQIYEPGSGWINE